MTPGWQKGVGSVIRPATLIPPPLLSWSSSSLETFPSFLSSSRTYSVPWLLSDTASLMTPTHNLPSATRDGALQTRGTHHCPALIRPRPFLSVFCYLTANDIWMTRHHRSFSSQTSFFLSFWGAQQQKNCLFFFSPRKRAGPVYTHDSSILLFMYKYTVHPPVCPVSQLKKKRQISFMRTHFPRGKRDKREPSLWHEK